MPLHWTIDSKARLFTTVGEGEVTLEDAKLLLQVVRGAGALSYRKLLDVRAVQSAMKCGELLELAAEIRAYHSHGSVGALAVVVTAEQTVKFARLLGALAAADRPMKLFGDVRQARPWLEKQQAGQ